MDQGFGKTLGHRGGVFQGPQMKRHGQGSWTGPVESDPGGESANLIAGAVHNQTLRADSAGESGPRVSDLTFVVLPQDVECPDDGGVVASKRHLESSALEPNSFSFKGFAGRNALG